MISQAYNQVFVALKEQIVNRFYLPDQKIPPERILCHEFGVSRITARHALRLLEEQGLVERIQGKGTFVRSLGIKKIPILSCDFTGSVRKEAPHLKRKLLMKDNIVPPAHIATILGLEKEQQCFFAIRLDFLKYSPLAYDRLYILSDLMLSFDDKTLAAIDFLKLWLKQEKLDISHYVEKIEAIEADSQAVEYLGIAAGSAMLLVTDICYSTDRKAIAVFESIYRGDRISLTSTTR